MSWLPQIAAGFVNEARSTEDATAQEELLKKTAAAMELAPHLVVHYLQGLAGDFHAWYNAEKFLVDDAATRLARLALADAARVTIVNGLALLGVSAPEKM